MPTSNPEIQGYTVNPASLDLQLWSLQHGSALEWALLGVAGDAPLTLVHPILDRLANKKQFDHPETFWKWRLVEAQPKKTIQKPPQLNKSQESQCKARHPCLSSGRWA